MIWLLQVDKSLLSFFSLKETCHCHRQSKLLQKLPYVWHHFPVYFDLDLDDDLEEHDVDFEHLRPLHFLHFPHLPCLPPQRLLGRPRSSTTVMQTGLPWSSSEHGLPGQTSAHVCGTTMGAGCGCGYTTGACGGGSYTTGGCVWTGGSGAGGCGGSYTTGGCGWGGGTGSGYTGGYSTSGRGTVPTGTGTGTSTVLVTGGCTMTGGAGLLSTSTTRSHVQ